MWPFLKAAIDLILPERPRVRNVRSYSDSDLTISPTTIRLHEQDIHALASFKDPVIADCIRALKYDASSRAEALLSHVLEEFLIDEIASMQAFSDRPIVLVPVPLHHDKERERGFNQVTKLLHSLPREFHDGTYSRIDAVSLQRTRATKQQARLSRAERLLNVRGAFELMQNSLPRDACIFLIDDVVTTGATISEAARPLREYGIHVRLLALASA